MSVTCQSGWRAVPYSWIIRASVLTFNTIFNLVSCLDYSCSQGIGISVSYRLKQTQFTNMWEPQEFSKKCVIKPPQGRSLKSLEKQNSGTSTYESVFQLNKSKGRNHISFCKKFTFQTSLHYFECFWFIENRADYKWFNYDKENSKNSILMCTSEAKS